MKQITIGIIAHVDSGKTTLSEALLYLTGTIRKFGRVDKGASFLDDNAMERQRGITIYSKQARFSHGNSEFILIDTPGHADFSAEMERALQVLDYAILLISASDGIKGQTETVWRLLSEYQIPTFIFFNKMDQDGADRTVLFHSFRTALSDNAVDFTKSGEEVQDAAAMCTEEAMEAYLEQGQIPETMLQEMIAARQLFPCFFGSALKMDGVQELLDAMDRFTIQPEYPSAFGARVYKILRDPDGSRLTLMKITGGTLKNKSLLPDGGSESKINQIRIYNGSKFTLQETVPAGEVCAVSGLKESFAGQGFGLEAESVLPLMIPILSYRVLLPAEEDPIRVLPYFKTLEEENPELTVDWEEERQEIHVCVMGEVQLEVLTVLLRERFHLEVSFDAGEVMYKETISQPVVGVGHFEPLRHYAEVHLLMEPLPRGSGLVFDASVSVDQLAKNWQRLILTHLEERQHRGVLTGSPITDMRITLIAGKAHLKHTEGGDFRQAVYRAVRQGLMMTESQLLEPYYRFVLDVPAESIGRAMHDLERMQAQFGMPEMNTERGTSVIKGRGPVSALKDYPRELASYTRGQGNLSFTNDGFDLCTHPEEVIQRRGYDPLADVRNTPDSVFCAHGSGYIVPYDQVYDYMHLSLDGSSEQTPDESGVVSKDPNEIHRTIGQDEIDAIIASIAGSNRKEKKKGNTWKRKFGQREDGDMGSGNANRSMPAASVRSAVFPIEDAQYIVVDGYNVIFAWQELSDLARVNIDSARDTLIDILSKFQSMSSGKVIAVFDAYHVKGHATERMQMQDVQIIFTGEEETADQYIEKFTNAHGRKERIVVVTSDHLEQIITQGQGCMLISSREFKTHIARLSDNLRQQYHLQ